MSQLISDYLARGGVVHVCRAGFARGRLVWQITNHPTHNLPLALGVVGRW